MQKTQLFGTKDGEEKTVAREELANFSQKLSLALNWHKSWTALHGVIKFLGFKQEHRVPTEITQSYSGDVQPFYRSCMFWGRELCPAQGKVLTSTLKDFLSLLEILNTHRLLKLSFCINN